MKKLILINILFWALCIIIPMQVKADTKTETTVGHVISETINQCKRKELKYYLQRFNRRCSQRSIWLE